jgi:UDP-glucose 4-epimerase
MKIMPTDPWEHMKSWLSMQRKKDSGSNVPVVIVTGGAGFIGSHTCVELVAAGYDVVVVDSLVNASEESITRVKEITGKPDMVTLFKVDLCDMRALDNVFAQCSKVHAVIHFAGLKAVGESVSKPLTYFENNLGGTFNLLRCMDKYECRRLVFSSSATVYGSAPIPYTETSQVGLGITNPYGRTKFMIEEIVRDLHTSAAGKEWSFVLLRYFNPVGAHPTGKIGEDPDGIPNNLMPYISQVAVGTRASLTIFGGPGNEPYDTPDGTCRRDFIHVVDLAQGHVTAIKRMDNAGLGKCDVYNLGSGKPVSVLELVAAMEKATGKKLSYTIGPRRAGDLPQFWANPDKAAAELNWKTTKTVDEMCADSWSWQRQNPRGFKK